MGKPLVSVVIPAYNGAATLALTIESVLQQTLQSLEIIVVDDGSTDDTHVVAERYRGDRRGRDVRVLRFANAGVSVSRNRGLSHARGTYISFLDADDIWTPEKLERQLAALTAHGSANVAYSFTNWIDCAGVRLPGGLHIQREGDVYQALLVQDFVGSGSNPLIKRSCFAEVGAFDPTLHPAEDWDMWLRLAARYAFVCVPEPDVLYRKLSVSASSNVDSMADKSMRIIARHLAEHGSRLPRGIRSRVMANRYEYLMYKSLERPLTRQKALKSLGFLAKLLAHDRTMLRRGKLLAVVLGKIALTIIHPASTGWIVTTCNKRKGLNAAL